MARMADVLAEVAREGVLVDSGGAVVVMVGGVRRKWWLKVVWGRRHRVMIRIAPWVRTSGMEVKSVRRAW